MAQPLRLTGVPAWEKRINLAKRKLPEIMAEATADALDYLEEQAQRILDQAIYQKQRAPFARQPTFELYRAFTMRVAKIGMGVVGTLANTSPYAPYLEYGTDDEGTGTHVVPVAVAQALHWINPETGQEMFAKQVVVKGIKPIRFMRRALNEHTDEVVAIYEKHLAELFDT